MKNYSYIATFLISMILLLLNLKAQPTLAWAKQIEGTNSNGGSLGANGDKGWSIAVDANGNVYTTGAFEATADFDPGPGVYNLTSAGGSDIFISKLDANGNFVWTKQMGGTANDQGLSIIVDANGNVYTTGVFRGTVDFDPGAGVYNLTAVVGNDVFISKLDVNGNFLWAKQMGSGGNTRSNSIALDANGNIYTTGNFQNTADFDPGAGVYNLTSIVGNDVFISKLDANGNFIWAKQIECASTNWSNSIAVDASENVYTTGYFQGTADFDSGFGTYNLTSAGSDDIFVSKLDILGNFLWAKQMGGTTSDRSFSIALDANGNSYTTGNFTGTADFDSGPGVYNLTSVGGQDVFVSKLDANGNFIWAKQMGGTSNELAYSIAIDANEYIYTTGYCNGVADFDPGPGVFNLNATNGGHDIFISKLDANGNFLCAASMGGAGHERSHFIAVDASENVYTTGYFQGTADFDPSMVNYNLTSAISSDVFIVKVNTISCNSILPITLLNFEATNIQNKAVLVEWITATETNNDFFTIERSIDAVIFEQIGTVQGAVNSNTLLNYQYMDATLNPKPQTLNTLYYRLKQTDFNGNYEYSDIKAVNLENNNSLIDVEIYPNPTNNEIFINLQKDDYQLLKFNLVNTIGKEMEITIKNTKQQTILSLPSTVPKGIYFLTIQIDNQIITKKIIKN